MGPGEPFPGVGAWLLPSVLHGPRGWSSPFARPAVSLKATASSLHLCALSSGMALGVEPELTECKVKAPKSGQIQMAKVHVMFLKFSTWVSQIGLPRLLTARSWRLV